jgi:hypothetical protein
MRPKHTALATMQINDTNNTFSNTHWNDGFRPRFNHQIQLTLFWMFVQIL